MKKKKQQQQTLVEKLNDLISEIQQIINDEDGDNVNQSFIEYLDFAVQNLESAVEEIE